MERVDEIKDSYIKGEIAKDDAEKELKWLLNSTKKSKMTKEEKKELAHKIIRIVLEVLLNILTAGIPMLTKIAKRK